MNALFHRFHYFISQLVRGEDHVCACTCGRHQVHHVVPYNEVQSMEVSRESNFLSDILTQQKTDVIVGLFLGICISYVLLWLNRVWFPGFKIWRTDQMNDVGFWSRIPKFSGPVTSRTRTHGGLQGGL
ncbi:transmembrane protein 240-like [Morone saxatilis]|uniref:transmembrane protein 240-like n=1 Tax=Morone saxatilis TaxID=34816 RepID=UPI0015E204EF|nr:transmembrane protein 240-like [Morone saxatilis]XP_035517354.1 transmembrane protein 240-like [Morone saxatilis]